MRYFLPYLVLLSCLSWSIPLAAQEQYTFELINQKSLASFGAIYNLYQDSSGIIWLGHFGKGLSYYNGKKISRFRLPNEGAFADKTSVFEESGGLLYLNYGHVVKCFDPIRQVLVDSISMPQQAIGQAPLYAIKVDPSSSDIWAIQVLAEEEQPLQSLSTTFEIWHSKGGEPFRKVTQAPLRVAGKPFLKLYRGRCFVKAKKGLLEIGSSGPSGRQYLLNELVDLQELTADNTLLDSLGKFWFTVHKSFSRPLELYSLNIETGQVRQVHAFPMLSLEHIEVLVPSPLASLKMEGDFLFLNAQHQFNWKTETNRDFAQLLPQGVLSLMRLVKDVMIDKTGVIFVGSKLGVSKLIPQPQVFKLLPRIATRSFVEDEQGRIYGAITFPIYGEQAGIAVYDPQKDSVSWIPLPFMPYWYSAVYKDQKIYFGNREFDLDTRSVSKFKDPEQKVWNPFTVLQLLVDDQIWSTRWEANAIEVYDRKTLELVKTIDIPYLKEIKVDLNDLYLRPSDSTVWLGTFGKGIFVFSKAGKLLHHLSTDQNSKIQLRSNTVSAFYEDTRQNMWIGQVSGLSRIAPDLSAIEHFLIDPDNPDFHIVYGLLPEDEDRFLWLSSNQGLFRFDSQNGTFMDFPLNPFVMDVEYNRTSYHKSKTGRMYFSGTYDRNHTVAFYPDTVVNYYQNEEARKAPIIFTQFSRFDGEKEQLFTQTKGLSTLEYVTLQPGDRYFS
ncbi:MAG: hypothetical protein KDC44_16360, partial [Phaeodactylibacter sp.]|nr:hypothetical protein [Phaeodactylibacter sp.]